MMKRVLIIDGVAETENPNDPSYANGLTHEVFRNRSNKRLRNFAEACLDADEVEIAAAEELNFDEFCRLLACSENERTVLSGSAYSVHDDVPWINDLREALIETKKNFRVPIVGICFGAQLLAVTEGGKVNRLSEPRKGIVRMMGVDFKVAVNHTEIISPPESFEVFGKSVDGLPYLMRNGDDFAIQPHPETPFSSVGDFENPWRKLLALE